MTLTMTLHVYSRDYNHLLSKSIPNSVIPSSYRVGKGIPSDLTNKGDDTEDRGSLGEEYMTVDLVILRGAGGFFLSGFERNSYSIKGFNDLVRRSDFFQVSQN